MNETSAANLLGALIGVSYISLFLLIPHVLRHYRPTAYRGLWQTLGTITTLLGILVFALGYLGSAALLALVGTIWPDYWRWFQDSCWVIAFGVVLASGLFYIILIFRGQDHK